MLDVVVLGAGPAGLALAAACRRVGLTVAVVAPEPEAPWEANYGSWAFELPEDWPEWAEASWPEVVVQAVRRHVLPGPYVRVDARRLQAKLLGEVPDRRRGTADSAPKARVVVDATGALSPRVRRRGDDPPGWQVAWGELLTVEGAPVEMILMDWSDADAPESGAPAMPANRPPSFLYAMPLLDGRWFAEETVLVGRPEAPLDLLRTRLQTRLDRMGVKVTARHAVERCRIPMGFPLPTGDVPAFGAAASFVHPATGYSLARSLRLAAPAARALAEGTSLHAACWPASDARAWALHRFGMEVLITLDAPSIRAFFDAFFDQAPEVWRAWLAGTLGPGALAAAMLAHFGRLGWDLRGRLAAAGMSRDGLRLAGELLRG